MISLFFINLIFAILPSFIWLHFYLREDRKPEPKRMVLMVFLFGLLFIFPALAVELGLVEIFAKAPKEFFNFLKFFLGIAFVEEFFKFLVVFLFVFGNKEFDEPIDGMIYMLISGLGFAAGENLFLLLSQFNTPETLPVYITEILQISFFRFLGATFLHALSSAILGYFATIYYFYGRNTVHLFFGLLISTTLHYLFNLSIMAMEELQSLFPILLSLLILGVNAVLVSLLFKRLKTIKLNVFSQ